jgi:hypothetical protein
MIRKWLDPLFFSITSNSFLSALAHCTAHYSLPTAFIYSSELNQHFRFTVFVLSSYLCSFTALYSLSSTHCPVLTETVLTETVVYCPLYPMIRTWLDPLFFSHSLPIQFSLHCSLYLPTAFIYSSESNQHLRFTVFVLSSYLCSLLCTHCPVLTVLYSLSCTHCPVLTETVVYCTTHCLLTNFNFDTGSVH